MKKPHDSTLWIESNDTGSLEDDAHKRRLSIAIERLLCPNDDSQMPISLRNRAADSFTYATSSPCMTLFITCAIPCIMQSRDPGHADMHRTKASAAAFRTQGSACIVYPVTSSMNTLDALAFTPLPPLPPPSPSPDADTFHPLGMMNGRQSRTLTSTVRADIFSLIQSPWYRCELDTREYPCSWWHCDRTFSRLLQSSSSRFEMPRISISE